MIKENLEGVEFDIERFEKRGWVLFDVFWPEKLSEEAIPVTIFYWMTRKHG